MFVFFESLGSAGTLLIKNLIVLVHRALVGIFGERWVDYLSYCILFVVVVLRSLFHSMSLIIQMSVNIKTMAVKLDSYKEKLT